jgi:hypothetical protein
MPLLLVFYAISHSKRRTLYPDDVGDALAKTKEVFVGIFFVFFSSNYEAHLGCKLEALLPHVLFP